MKSLSYLALFAVGVSCSAIAQAQENADGERIVVTGSRIVRDGSQMPTPVTVVTAETLTESAPSNIPDALNKLPQFSGSNSQTAGGTFNAGSAPLGNFLNLRGLGTGRLLVLLDGQRVSPTARSNAVDVNVLPQMLVERVDIVTGGVSAIYGSDAVSGVVNYVLDDSFTGLKTNAQAGISDYGDSFSVKLGAAAGVDIGDSLHFMGSYEYYDINGLDDLWDRPWAPWADGATGSGTVASPIIQFPISTRYTISRGGTIPGSFQLSQYIAGQLGEPLPYGVRFTPDGQLVPMNPGDIVSGNQASGGDGGVWGIEGNSNSITGGLETHQAFGRLSADLSPSTRAWVQGTYATSKTNFNSTPNNHITGTRATTIFGDNPFLREEYQDVVGPTGSFRLQQIYNDIPVVTNDTSNEYISGQIGLDGEIGSNWRWNAVYNYGRAEQTIVFNEFMMRNFFAAVDSIREVTGPQAGQIVCRVNSSFDLIPGTTTVNTANDLDGCAPINLLGAGNITQDAFDWTRQDSISTAINEVQYIAANVQGEVFDLPGGPVSVSLGAEYRKQKLDITSNSDPAFFSDENGNNPALRAAYFSGIRGVPSSAQLFDSINIGIASGDLNVKEAYGEIVIPILSGTPGAEYLELDLAGRYTDYSTSGSVKTWKVGVIWQPIDDIRVRFNRSRDIAAPTLNDLFAGENVSATGFNDIHLLPEFQTQPVPLRVVAGNPTLAPEKADTLTLGVVIQPSALPGLTLSIDAYNIKVKDAIDNPDAGFMLQQCEDSGGTAAVCDNFERNPNLPWEDRTFENRVRRYFVSPQNLALLETQGIDFEVAYRMPIGPGDLTLRAYVNYLDKFDTQQRVDTAAISNVGLQRLGDGFGMQRWKGLLTQTYRTDRFSVGLSERFTGSYENASPRDVVPGVTPDGKQVYANPFDMPNVVYVDLNTTYNFGEEGNIVAFLNVQNLFNTDPPTNLISVSNLNIPTDKNTYDVLGRYFTVGVRTRF